MSDKVAAFLQESNQIEGVVDYDSFVDAAEAWEYAISQDSMTSNTILKIHKILMEKQAISKKDIGHWRTCQVYVGGHEGARWEYLPDIMEQWLDVFNYNVKAEIKGAWKMTHVGFERIHPFVDGNGRVGRILMNWYRIKVGLPIMVIWYSKRQNYYRWFI